jgi:hypothetical protein
MSCANGYELHLTATECGDGQIAKIESVDFQYRKSDGSWSDWFDMSGAGSPYPYQWVATHQPQPPVMPSEFIVRWHSHWGYATKGIRTLDVEYCCAAGGH